jgi:hypothetical protein
MFMIAPVAVRRSGGIKQYRYKSTHTNGDVRPTDAFLTRLFLDSHGV